MSLAARKKRRTEPSPKEQEKTKEQKKEARGQKRHKRRRYDKMVLKTCLLQDIKDPYKEKIREAIRNRVESNSSSVRDAGQGMVHFLKEWYHDITVIETVDILGEFFNKTSIRHLMLSTGETSRRNERVHALHEIYAGFRFSGTRYRGDSRIYTYGAMKYLTNLKNYLTMNLERFVIRSIFALYPGLTRQGMWTIIDGITNDSKNEQEIEFVDEKTSRSSTNEASVIRAAIKEHHAVLGLANSAEKLSELQKDKERRYPLILRYSVFLNGKLERMAHMEQGVEGNAVSEKRKAALLEKCFNVVPLCNIKSHFVTIDSRVLYGIMKEICPEFDVRKTEFSGENRETYWKNIFDFKRLRVSKQKARTGVIESDRVAICVHYRRLKADRPVPSSILYVTKHEDEKEAGPATQKVHENHFVVGAGPGNTNIMTITTRHCGDDGVDGNLRQKHTRVLKR